MSLSSPCILLLPIQDILKKKMKKEEGQKGKRHNSAEFYCLTYPVRWFSAHASVKCLTLIDGLMDFAPIQVDAL